MAEVLNSPIKEIAQTDLKNMIQLCTVYKRLTLNAKTQNRLKVKGQKTTFHANNNQSIAEVAILTAGKMYF